MKLVKRPFGTLSDGRSVSLFTISSADMSISVTDLGCTVTSILLPAVADAPGDIVLGYSTLEGYVSNWSLFGATVGRYAGRIGGASFTLDGTTCVLHKNNSGNCLHGGFPFWQGMLWQAKPYRRAREAGVVFSRRSPDGEQGFPGNLDVRVTIGLTAGNDVVIRYGAKTDAPTPLNLTNHTYFNLAGHGAGPVLDHELTLFADSYLPVDGSGLPTGEICPVADTPFDFRTARPVGWSIGEKTLPGYDHTWAVRRTGKPVEPVAIVREPKTGRSLTVSSSLPGVQFYTAPGLAEKRGKNGFWYGSNEGFCLESQFFPDSPNRPAFPDATIRPGDQYMHTTVWHFGF